MATHSHSPGMHTPAPSLPRATKLPGVDSAPQAHSEKLPTLQALGPQLFSWTAAASGHALFLGEGNGNPVQYSCLENPMDRGAWQATVHGVAKSRT